MIGKTISNYIIKELIADGGMGAVYLCQHKSLTLKSALKILHPQYLSNNDISKRFEQEAKTLSELSHPNIIKILDFGDFEDRQFLLMEYFDATPLDEYITHKVGPVNEEDSLKILNQIIDAIEVAHKNGIIHRDIKPSNILIDENKNVKLIDFGIAKDTDNKNHDKTKVGQMLGTLPYMSPEQVRGKDVDFRTDIYSIGVLLHQMACGKPPYSNDLTEFDIIKKITEEPLDRIKNIYPGAPEYFQSIIDKATQKNKEDRFLSCSEFRKSLKERAGETDDTKIYEAETKLSTKDNTNVTPTPKKKKKGIYIIIILLVALSVGGYFLFDYLNNDDSTSTNDTKKEQVKLDDTDTKEIKEKEEKEPVKSEPVKDKPSKLKYKSIPNNISSIDEYFEILPNTDYSMDDRNKLKAKFLKQFETNDVLVKTILNGTEVDRQTIEELLDEIIMINKQVKVINKEKNNDGKYTSLEVEEL